MTALTRELANARKKRLSVDIPLPTPPSPDGSRKSLKCPILTARQSVPTFLSEEDFRQDKSPASLKRNGCSSPLSKSLHNGRSGKQARLGRIEFRTDTPEARRLLRRIRSASEHPCKLSALLQKLNRERGRSCGKRDDIELRRRCHAFPQCCMVSSPNPTKSPRNPKSKMNVTPNHQLATTNSRDGLTAAGENLSKGRL
jgi:hypothetical protein